MIRLKTSSRFLRNENGSLSVEACFSVPLLAWAIVATFVFFDAFKTLNTTQKATYTIADMVSREEVELDDDYVTALHEVFTYLSGQQGGPSAIRVSTVSMRVDEDTGDEFLQLDNSEGILYDDLTAIDAIEDRIPDLAPGEQLIVVESVQQWTPAFGVGLATYQFREVALARPRFAPRICWESQPNCAMDVNTPTDASTDDGEV
ncbi:MAG: hypothetical protein AAF222_06000 [Pseudomonadota bacterium]